MKKTILSILAGLMACSGISANRWAPAGENIRTRWAAEVGPDNARPEYPRPQMVRKSWKCLNGLWEYVITPAHVQTMPEAEGEILVPYCVESSLSGVACRVGEDNVLWYRTTVEVPEKWKNETILLHFDAVDWKADVFIDGVLAATHTGGYTSFAIDVTEYLKKGPAELVVKVWDPTNSTEHCIPHGKQVNDPSGIWYTPVTGIWQSVWLESVPKAGYISDYNVRTDIEAGVITVDADCVGALPGDVIRVDVLRPKIGYNPEKPGWSIFRKGRAYAEAGSSASVKLRRPKLWSNDAPYLYGLKICLIRDGRVIDKVQGYTSLRSISAKADGGGVKRFALNGNILFHFGPLDQGWWPDGLYTAPTAEAMAWDVEMVRKLGFNMIRKHIKVEPSRWYYDCDRLGIMVWQDMPSVADHFEPGDWAQSTNAFDTGRDYPLTEWQKSNYYKELDEIMAQLRKFQCIVSWIPFNEAWGQFDTGKVVDFIMARDSSRPVNAASGGNWISGVGDVVDSHYYPNPQMRLWDDAKINVLGEYGGIGYPVEGHLWNIGKRWGYVEFQSTEEVTDQYVRYAGDLLKAKLQDKCAAAVYTQTTDVEGEVNGFFTYDREVVKMNVQRVFEANRKVIASKTTE